MLLAVLASGSGTIFSSIVDSGLLVDRLVVDRPCPAVSVARAAGVRCEVIDRRDFGTQFDRGAFTDRIVAALTGIDVVAMAGFMTVLGPAMFDAFPARVLNTHPSLLPSFPGAHAVPDALAAGVRITGCTVHIATERVDHGPILAQEAVAVAADDDEASLHERIKAVERRLYPLTIKEFLA